MSPLLAKDLIAFIKSSRAHDSVLEADVQDRLKDVFAAGHEQGLLDADYWDGYEVSNAKA